MNEGTTRKTAAGPPARRRSGQTFDPEVIERFISLAFRIWVRPHHNLFAREALRLLTRAGQLDFQTSFEYTRPALRLIGVRKLYGDFCYMAFDERSYTDVEGLSEFLRIDQFCVGQLAEGEAFDSCVGEQAPYGDALNSLLAGDRRGLVRSLVEVFGGEAWLLQAMWLDSRFEGSRGDVPSQNRLRAYRRAARVDQGLHRYGEALGAYHWILEGCYCISAD